MIISHKYKFIFIKTAKTAGTSIETFLSPLCGKNDVFTQIIPIGIEEMNHKARNYSAYFNPLPEIRLTFPNFKKYTIKQFLLKKKFYHHIPAFLIRCRIQKDIWNSYYKFCVERNPWDKALSHYHYIRHRSKFCGLSSDEYLKKGLSCINYPRYTEFGGPNTIIVDRIIKYENLTDEFSEVFDYLGIPFDGSFGIRAKSNYRTDRRPYHEVLNHNQIIKDTYRQEILLHNFVF